MCVLQELKQDVKAMHLDMLRQFHQAQVRATWCTPRMLRCSTRLSRLLLRSLQVAGTAKGCYAVQPDLDHALVALLLLL
jgi:hypothetical protein